MINKNTLRQVYLEKRLTLSRDEYKKRNYLLLERLFNYLDVKEVHYLHTFLSMPEKNEVDTYQIISKLKRLNPGMTIAISKTLPKGELSHYIYNDYTIIKKSRWGVPEPVEGEAASISDIDVILVPLISFDKTGHRIGYGKGYYDRFLTKVPQAKKIGVALTPPLDIIAYANELDIKLDACVTPFDLYNFSKKPEKIS